MTTLTFRGKVWRFLALAVFTCGVTARAKLYEAAVPGTNSGSLRLNIPDSLPVVKGIYFWGNGGVSEGRNRATDPEMLAVADQLGFAVIGSAGIALTYSYPVGDVPGFEAALAALARASGHPELVRAPLLPIGASNGGIDSFDLNAALPERVLATELAKAGDAVPLPPLAALKTPGILVAGELDTADRIAGVRARFFDNRPRGALWAWVEEEGTNHDQVNSPEIAWPFAVMVARLRYPSGASPVNGPVALIAMNEADGWLTDPNSYKTGLADIAPYASYTKDKSIAGWLPNKRAAYIFRAFASYNKATASATLNVTSRLVDPGTTLVYSLSEPVAPWSSIEYYEGDVLLKRVTPGDANPLSVQFSTNELGYVVLHALVTFSDGRQRTTMPRRALVRVPPPPDLSTKPDTIIGWGSGTSTLVPLLNGTRMLVAGRGFAAALKSDGTVVAWGGDNFYGQLNVPAGLSNVVQISVCDMAGGAVKSDGTVVMWGSNLYGERDVPAGLGNVRQLAVGGSNVLALKNDGTVTEWGHRDTFIPMPTNLNGIVAVAANNGNSLALKNDGTVVSWDHGSLPPAGLQDVVAISAGISHSVALKADGTVVAWGSNTYNQTSLPAGLSNVVAIAAGAWHTVALKSDGTVVSWGGSFSSTPTVPTPASTRGTRWITAGYDYSYAVLGSQISVASSPQSQLARAGDYVEFGASAVGAGNLTYQWRKNGVAIFGATSDTLTLSSAQAADSGIYSVTISDGASYVTSAGATLAIAGEASGDNTPRLANLATRAVVGTGDDVLIPGIAISGAGKKKLIVRVSGPALAELGVAGALTHPQLRFYGGSNEIAANTGWSSGTGANTTALLSAFAQVGLPPFAAGSADCALLADVDPGMYTAIISGVEGRTGVALVEVYELGTSTARLVAIACRARVGTGDDVLISGIAIAGSGTKRVIIRASGPALTRQGVAGVLAKPFLEIYDASGKIAENAGWSSSANVSDLSLATAAVGLPPFVAGSADCAVLLSLPTGGYTAKVSGLSNTTGVALVEVYEVP